MNKQVSNQQQPANAGQVANSKGRRTRKAAKPAQPEVQNEPLALEISEGEQSQEQQQEKKGKKVVDIRIERKIMEIETDKAILLVVAVADKNVKFWLPKSQVKVMVDAADDDNITIRIAGWLWYRQNLGSFFTAERWATEAV